MLQMLILSATIATTQSAPPYRDYPFLGCRIEDVQKLDGIAIVQARKRLGESIRAGTFANSSASIQMMSDEVSVVDSDSFPKGALLHVVAPSRGDGEVRLYPLLSGQFYVLISMKGDGKQLRFPDANMGRYDVLGSAHIGPLQYDYDVAQNSPNEVAGLAVFHTSARAFAKTGTSGERLLSALVDAFPGASADDALRTAAFLKTLRPSEFDDQRKVFSDTDLTRRMRTYAESASLPYVKAKIYETLVAWHVLKSEGPFVRAVAAAEQDPTAFADPRDNMFVDIYFGTSLLPGYIASFPDGNWSVDALMAAQNPTVRYFFACNLFSRPDDAHIARLVSRLSQPDERLQEVLLDQLAALFHDKARQPQFVVVGGERRVKNKEELIAHWRSRFAQPPPRRDVP